MLYLDYTTHSFALTIATDYVHSVAIAVKLRLTI